MNPNSNLTLYRNKLKNIQIKDIPKNTKYHKLKKNI